MSSTQYACHGFHASLPNGRASGELKVFDHQLQFQVGGQTVVMNIPSTQVNMGGANNRLIFFSHPHHPEWHFYTSDRSILNDVHLLRHPHIAKVFQGAKRSHVFGWSLIVSVVFLIVALPSVLILRMDILSAMVARQIPQRWEAQLGDSTLAQYRLGKDFMTEKQAQALLQPLTSVLIESLPSDRYQYQFHIINDGTVNAFALPGGNVVIHSALILKADSAEELLGVLAHEMMHVELQHGVRNVIGTAGIYVVIGALFGDVSGILATLSSAAPILINQGYSRRFEGEADREAVYLLHAAGIHPRGLRDFFETLIEEEEKQLVTIEDEVNRERLKTVMGYLSTHPATQKRIAALEQEIEHLPAIEAPRQLAQEFASLQAAVQQFVADMEGDTDEQYESGSEEDHAQ